MGLGPRALRKLQSCLVAAEAACSKGDFPVVTVVIALAAVEGLATATETAAVPAELATPVAELPRASNGAAQPVTVRQRKMPPIIRPQEMQKADQPDGFDLLEWEVKIRCLFALADNVKYPCCPRCAYNGFKFTIGSFVIGNYFAATFTASELFVFDWAIANCRAVVFIDPND
jgi:hypothetical protein